MAKTNHQYPGYLNPFGSDEEEDEDGSAHRKGNNKDKIDYPDHLSPFGDDDDGDEGKNNSPLQDDYDNSLNPFESDGEAEDDNDTKPINAQEKTIEGNGNPFDQEDEPDKKEVTFDKELPSGDKLQEDHLSSMNSFITNAPQVPTSQPDSLEPPKPLPRTKSLLKKEQALRNKQLQQQTHQQSQPVVSDQPNSLVFSISSSTIQSSPATNNATQGVHPRKSKRNAPPVPVNFKREVTGSLEDIESELNEIGDKLEIYEKNFSSCQETLQATYHVNETEFAIARETFVELIKSKNSIVRRQKELMYRKRELKLDQIHSDIEYELRIIGNKQLSNRTPDDEAREKELLKKLVEIVEEKNDIVENLNKDHSNDSQDITEAFRRLNIEYTINKTDCDEINTNFTSVKSKDGKCDKPNGTKSMKLSKIATLLPKSGTIKGSIKMKRKRLFKKAEPRQLER